MSGLRGHLWMIREFGCRRWWRYECARREGVVIDYAKIMTPEQRAVLGEHVEKVPWERGDDG